LLNLRTTSAGPSFAQQIGDYAWAGSAVLVVIGLTMSCLACYYMGMINAGYMRKVVIGPARLLNAYHADPVTFFASGNLPRNKKREAPLPPMRPAHEIEEERRDNDAISSLADAWDLATLKGMRHLVSKVDDPDPIQARLLKDAIRIATSRGLQAPHGSTWHIMTPPLCHSSGFLHMHSLHSYTMSDSSCIVSHAYLGFVFHCFPAYFSRKT